MAEAAAAERSATISGLQDEVRLLREQIAASQTAEAQAAEDADPAPTRLAKTLALSNTDNVDHDESQRKRSGKENKAKRTLQPNAGGHSLLACYRLSA